MKKMIFGTDWAGDADDVLALKVLLEAHKRGMVELLGISIDDCLSCSVASVDGFLKQYGVSFPIGIDLKAKGTERPTYQKRLATYSAMKNEDAEDGVRLYRRLLAESDEKVDIIEVGYLQVLWNLLRSSGDDISPLSGIELVKQKVEKLWIMGGKWNVVGGRENNLCCFRWARRAANGICRLWPTEITFLGYEVANKVVTGSKLKDGDVLKQVLIDYNSPQGKKGSWDPMLTYLACVQNEQKAGYARVSGKARVNRFSGRNYFTVTESGKHFYVVKCQEDAYYVDRIDGVLAGEDFAEKD